MTVAVIDDDPAVLDSLRMLLTSHGLEIDAYSSAAAFLAGRDAAQTQCVVCDVRMPGMTGMDLLLELKAAGDPTPLIVITGHGDVTMAVTALKNGAFDFIEKPFNDERLLASLANAVERGARALSEQAAVADVTARMALLTERQRQVMDLVVEGLSNKEIANALGISPRTVENYRAWVMEKMGAGNLADLVRRVLHVQSRQ